MTARPGDDLAWSVSSAPYVMGLGSAMWAVIDHSPRVIAFLPLAVVLQFALVAADRRRLRALGHSPGNSLSWVPFVHLRRRAAALHDPEGNKLARLWAIVAASSVLMFALAVHLALRGPACLPACPRDLATTGLGALYVDAIGPGGHLAGGCTGLLPGPIPPGVGYVVERSGDMVVVTMRPGIAAPDASGPGRGGGR